MQVFYIENIEGSECLLPPEEARHAITVLRMKEGDAVRLIDGKGGFYTGILQRIQSKEVWIEIGESRSEYGKRPYQFHLLIAPAKNSERTEWLIEKAVEIGLDRLTLLLCAHSERKKIRTDRLERIVISSMKQSLTAYKPIITSLTPFAEALESCSEDHKTLAHCRDELPRRSLPEIYTPTESLAVCIGPEGDFSREEIELAEKAGFRGISLGESRLRTETAGLVACCSAAFMNQKINP